MAGSGMEAGRLTTTSRRKDCSPLRRRQESRKPADLFCGGAAERLTGGAQPYQGFVAPPVFLLLCKELYAEDRICNDQENNCQVNGNIADGYHIKKLPSYVLQVAFIGNAGAGKPVVGFGNRPK